MTYNNFDSMDPQIKDKLEETESFLGEMENSFQDDKKFKYMYSAFLSSGQSTLYYLVSRYKDTPGFNDWYWGKKVAKGIKEGGRIDNPEIKHLMNARGNIIHVENMQQGATRELSIGCNCTIVDQRAPKEKVTIKPGTLERPVSLSSPKTVVR
jgi:hypothetical protein